MSHFVVGAIIPKGKMAVEHIVSVMERYDENREGNSEAKWDWYRIGGRWDGWISGLPAIPDNHGGFNFDAKFETVERNVIDIASLLSSKDFNERVPFALITPEGEWIERGKMWWWAIVEDEKQKDAWNAEVRHVLEKYSDLSIVALDCHI